MTKRELQINENSNVFQTKCQMQLHLQIFAHIANDGNSQAPKICVITVYDMECFIDELMRLFAPSYTQRFMQQEHLKCDGLKGRGFF